MMLIFAILTAFLASGVAKNVTFDQVAEPIADHYIIVMEPGYEVVPIQNLILRDRSGIFDGATIKHTYTKAINGFSAKLSKRALEKLLTREEIKYISQDGIVRTSTVPSWGLDRIGQRNLPLNGAYSFTGNGSGVNVYVIDSGIYPESMYFGGRAKAAYDAVGTGVYGIDCDGHGTHCAGTIGSEIFGVAPGVNLFGVRVLGCEGYGTTADVVAGCDYVANNFEQPAVASMSIEGPPHRALDDAVRGIIAAGITTVVAAGNLNRDSCLISPARVTEAITVGATGINDRRASFSNYGHCVDVFAPGVFIPSVWIDGHETIKAISGTSMACPHVAGAAAVALANSAAAMSPTEVKSKLIDDTTKGVVADARPGSPDRLLFVP